MSRLQQYKIDTKELLIDYSLTEEENKRVDLTINRLEKEAAANCIIRKI